MLLHNNNTGILRK